jgi:hypothetical protein
MHSMACGTSSIAPRMFPRTTTYGSQLLTVAGWSMPSFFPAVALATHGWTLNCGGRSRSIQRIGGNGRVEAGPKSALRAETCPRLRG